MDLVGYSIWSIDMRKVCRVGDDDLLCVQYSLCDVLHPPVVFLVSLVHGYATVVWPNIAALQVEQLGTSGFWSIGSQLISSLQYSVK